MINEIRKEIEKENPRSKWGKAVIAYANELLDHLEDQIKFHGPSLEINEKTLLNGAENWKHFRKGLHAFRAQKMQRGKLNGNTRSRTFSSFKANSQQNLNHQPIKLIIMKPTHIITNQKSGTIWNVGSKVVLCVNEEGTPFVNKSGQGLFTDITGTVSITANISETKEL